MELIDWRELYAANRAVIEGHASPPTPRAAPPRRAPRARHAGAPAPAVGRRLRTCPCRAFASRASDVRDRAVTGQVEHHDGRRARPVRVHVPDGLDPATPRGRSSSRSTGAPRPRRRSPRARCSTGRRTATASSSRTPSRSREDNPQGCWNWFTAEHQSRGGGEPRVHRGRDPRGHGRGGDGWTIDPGRVFVVGMSAGGAMASRARGHPSRPLRRRWPCTRAWPTARAGRSPRRCRRCGSGGPDPEGQGRAALRGDGRRRPAPFPRSSSTAPPTRSCTRSTASRRSVSGWRRTGSPAATPPISTRPDAVVRDDAAGRLPLTRRTWTDGAGQRPGRARRDRGPRPRVVGRRPRRVVHRPAGTERVGRDLGLLRAGRPPDDRLVHGRPARVPVGEPQDGVAGPERGEHPGDARAQRALVPIDQSDDLHGWTVGAMPRLRTKSHPSVGPCSTAGRADRGVRRGRRRAGRSAPSRRAAPKRV